MHEILKSIATNSLSLFLVSLLFSGLVISGGFTNYILAGALITLFAALLDPIIKVLTLPFNILTLGLLSFLTVMAALFVLTIFYSSVSVNAFSFSGLGTIGLTVGAVHLSRFLSFVVISATIYFTNKAILWLFS